jgi:hypothetical protein
MRAPRCWWCCASQTAREARRANKAAGGACSSLAERRKWRCFVSVGRAAQLCKVAADAAAPRKRPTCESGTLSTFWLFGPEGPLRKCPGSPGKSARRSQGRSGTSRSIAASLLEPPSRRAACRDTGGELYRSLISSSPLLALTCSARPPRTLRAPVPSSGAKLTSA